MHLSGTDEDSVSFIAFKVAFALHATVVLAIGLI